MARMVVLVRMRINFVRCFHADSLTLCVRYAGLDGLDLAGRRRDQDGLDALVELAREDVVGVRHLFQRHAVRDDGGQVAAGEQVDAVLASGKTVRASMAEPVAVYLLYWTAFANADGQVGFREDPYSWDAQLATKIEARSAERAQATKD